MNQSAAIYFLSNLLGALLQARVISIDRGEVVGLQRLVKLADVGLNRGDGSRGEL